jgi:predicted Zn-dependent peptidase
MKRILASLLILLITASGYAQVDRSIRPKPAPAKAIELGDYKSYTLDNGLKIIVVKNDKLPRVSFSLVVDRDPFLEGDKAGFISLAGSLMRNGTANRTKEQLDKEVDFIGATLFTGATNAYASGLSKYSEEIIGLMADVALNPSFPQEEFDKLKKQSLTGIESAKDDPSSLSSRLSNSSLYSLDHPYGELETEASINNITIEDCKSFYNENWSPNQAYIVVVGDIKARKAKKLIKKYFGEWVSKEVSTREYEMPTKPSKSVVNIINRNSSVQTVIRLANTIDLQPGSEDIVAVQLMNQILGGGSMGRLFQNIREDKAYTYGAYSQYDSDELVGSFSANASVRNEVTDSSVVEFIKEFKRLQTEKVSEQELQDAKNNIIGSFGRNLERPQTIASFALNIARYNLPEDYYKTYLQRLGAVSADDILAASKKYINSDALIITAVGKAADIASKLEQFGEVTYYDFNGLETGAPSFPVPAGVTAESVINGYINAIGGQENLAKVKDISIMMSASISGMPMEATAKTLKKRPNLFLTEMNVVGFGTVQKVYFDGTKGETSGMQGSAVLEGDELEEIKNQGAFFGESEYLSNGYELNLVAINMVDGEEAYTLEVDKNGEVQTEYYSVKTGLKLREEATTEGPEGEMTVSRDYSDYRAVNGVMLPFKTNMSQGAQKIEMITTEAKINSGLKKSDFK